MQVEAWACRFMLDEAFDLGDVHIDRRDYVLVRVRTAGGLSGKAYALSRGAPVDVVVADVLAPLLIGLDALDIEAWTTLWRRKLIALGVDGMLMRALSLVDIALWDIKGQAAGTAVWRLLGGHGVEAPLMVVEGYPVAGETPELFAERLADRARQGVRWLKVANERDVNATCAKLEATRAAVGINVALVVDVVWAWHDVEEAIRIAQSWEPHALAWIEDPFPQNQYREMRQLRAAIKTPIAAGDEVTNPAVLVALVDQQCVDRVRVDAATVGGFSGVIAVRDHAVSAGFSLSTHIYPEIHQHCVFAWPDLGPVESYPEGGAFDCAHKFIEPGSMVAGPRGMLLPPQAPGLGLKIAWDVVHGHRLRHSIRS